MISCQGNARERGASIASNVAGLERADLTSRAVRTAPPLPLFAALFVATTALAQTTPPGPKKAAVFSTTGDPALAETAGKLDAQLTRALLSKKTELVDLGELFPPPEPGSLDAAKDLFKEGRAAYDNLDPEAAIQKFNDAVAAYQKHPVGIDAAALAEAYIWLGASQQMKGDANATKDAFTYALLTDPNATVDVEIHGQEMLKLLGEVRAALETHPKGKVALDSIPSGARAVVGNEEVGVTPVDELDVPSGRVRVVLTRPGYLPFGAFPEIPPNDRVELKPALEPTEGLGGVLADVKKLTTRGAFASDSVPPEAKAVGAKLNVRYLVLASVTSQDGKPTGEVQAWDLETGNKLKGLAVDVTSTDAAQTYTVADQVKLWIDNPPSPSKLKVPEVAKKWWFWAAVGGAAAVVAGGFVIARPQHRPDFVLGLP